jgi:hypothetical protein
MVVGCVGLWVECWILGRWRHLFRTTAHAREGAAAVVESEACIVAALNNKARGMFALILELRMVDYVESNVYDSMR